MRKKTIIFLGIFLLCGIVGAVGADNGWGDYNHNYNPKILNIKAHPNWQPEDIFKEGKDTIKKVNAFAFSLKADQEGVGIYKIQIPLFVRRVNPNSIKSAFLIEDENGNGKIDESEKNFVGGEGVVDLAQNAIIFSGRIDIPDDKIGKWIYYILAFDLVNMVPGAEIHIKLIKESISTNAGVRVDKADGPRPASYIFKAKLVKISTELLNDVVVGNQSIPIEITAVYKLGIELAEIRIEEAESAGWKIKEAPKINKEITRNDNTRKIWFELQLPEDAKLGEYTIPPIPIDFIDTFNFGEKITVSTKTMKVKKALFDIKPEAMPVAVTLGEPINYRVIGEFDQSLRQHEEFLSDWLARAKAEEEGRYYGKFFIQDASLTREPGDGFYKVELTYSLQYLKFPEACKVPSFDWSYITPDNELQFYTVPAMPIKVNAVYVQGVGIGLQPYAKWEEISQLIESESLTAGERLVLILIISLIFLGFVLQPPVRYIINKMKGGEPLFQEFRARLAFERACKIFEESAVKNTYALSRLLLPLGRYLEVLLKEEIESKEIERSKKFGDGLRKINVSGIGFSGILKRAGAIEAAELWIKLNEVGIDGKIEDIDLGKIRQVVDNVKTSTEKRGK